MKRLVREIYDRQFHVKAKYSPAGLSIDGCSRQSGIR